MIKIAHRGNVYGPNQDLENNPDYILNAIELGFEVEIDIWANRGNFYLGHDEPIYGVDPFFVLDLRNSAWFHCKNFEALDLMSKNFKFCNFFWHEEDAYTMTSNGYIWTYPGKNVGSNSILVDVDLTSGVDYDTIYGLCSDYVGLLVKDQDVY